MRGNKSIILIVILVLVIAAVIAVGVLVFGNSPEAQRENTVQTPAPATSAASASEEPSQGEKPDAPVADPSVLREQVKAESGTASRNEFQTMQGTDWLPFPNDAFGYVNSAFVDLDADGTEEAVILRTAEDAVFVDLYTAQGGSYTKTCSQKISDFDGATARMISLFRNETKGTYCIFAESLTDGTYTRTTEILAELFDLTPGSVASSFRFEWNSVVNTQGDLVAAEAALKAAGIPYSVYASSFDTRGSDFYLLCHIIHRVEDALAFEDMKGFLRISEEE